LKIQRLNDILTDKVQEVLFPYPPIELNIGADHILSTDKSKSHLYATIVYSLSDQVFFRFEFDGEFFNALLGYYSRHESLSNVSFFLSKDVKGYARIVFGNKDKTLPSSQISLGTELDKKLSTYYADQIGKIVKL
jgi:hypothetical protein